MAFFSQTTRVSRYQTGETNLDFTEARDSEWQWHQLGHMQVCTSHQTDNHASIPPLVFTGRMPFLPPNQQHQSTEGQSTKGQLRITQRQKTFYPDPELFQQIHVFQQYKPPLQRLITSFSLKVQQYHWEVTHTHNTFATAGKTSI